MAIMVNNPIFMGVVTGILISILWILFNFSTPIRTPRTPQELPEEKEKPKGNNYVSALLGYRYFATPAYEDYDSGKITIKSSKNFIQVFLKNGTLVHEQKNENVDYYVWRWRITTHRPGNWVEYLIEQLEPEYLIIKRKEEEEVAEKIASFMTIDDGELFNGANNERIGCTQNITKIAQDGQRIRL